jgi:hypothetical protein
MQAFRIVVFIVGIISIACTNSSKFSKSEPDPESVFIELKGEVVMPFADNPKLVLVKILEKNCTYSICDSLQVGQEQLLVFMMGHEPSIGKPRYKALDKSYPGMSVGNTIKMKIMLKRKYKGAPVSMQVHDYEIL